MAEFYSLEKICDNISQLSDRKKWFLMLHFLRRCRKIYNTFFNWNTFALKNLENLEERLSHIISTKQINSIDLENITLIQSNNYEISPDTDMYLSELASYTHRVCLLIHYICDFLQEGKIESLKKVFRFGLEIIEVFYNQFSLSVFEIPDFDRRVEESIIYQYNLEILANQSKFLFNKNIEDINDKKDVCFLDLEILPIIH